MRCAPDTPSSLRGTVPIRLGKQIIDPKCVATYKVRPC